jgi:hypothetical protein
MRITSSMTALLLGGAAAAGAGYALAQGIIPLPNPLGTELFTVYPLQPNGQPGGGQAQLNLNQIRNATGYLLIGSTTSAANTITISTATNELLITAQPASTSWILPASGTAFDAEQFQFCNVSNAALATNTSNVVAGAGTGINIGSTSQTSTSVTSLSSQTCLELAFSQTTKQWYRIR